MSSNNEFQLVREMPWFQGFANLVANETGRWWKTRRGLLQVLIWLVIVNGLMALIVAGTPDMTPDNILVGFLTMWGLILPIGVIILTQDAIIQEKQSGTAAWILSKPASRAAFILSKIAGNGLGILFAITLTQGVACYLQIWLSTGKAYPAPLFACALGLAFVSLLFYLTLTIVLGTLFNGRGAVISVPLALALIQKVLGGNAVAQIMPWNLTSAFGDNPALALSVATGQPVPSWIPLIATAAWCLIFTGIALWRFERDEF
jgi:ABC-2 type transport system permease protein